MKTELFKNILDKQLNIYWAGNEYYPAQYISGEHREQIKKIACERFYFEGAKSVTEAYDKVFEKLYHKLYDLIFERNSGNNYEIIIEQSAKKHSKIRSHKGLFGKTEFYSKNLLEIEAPLKDETIIAAMIKLTRENYRNFVTLVLNYRCAFILKSDIDYFSKETLFGILNKYRNEGTNTSINYLDLIVDFCSNGGVVFKMSGDGGDNYLTIDMYYKMQ